MKRTVKLLAALIPALVLTLTGCGGTKPLVQSTALTVTDSVTVIETLRDTTVTVAADSSMIRAHLVSDSIGQIRIQQIVEYRGGERVKPPQLTIKDNVLTAKVEVDSLTLALQIKDILEKHNRTESNVVSKTEIVEVNRLSWWQTLWVKAGKVTVSAALLAIIGFLLKPKISTLWQTIRKKQ